MSERTVYRNGMPHTIWHDPEDGVILDLYNLYIMKCATNNHYYLQGVLKTDKARIRVQMSRIIMNTPKGKHCHHIGHTLDNRRANLSNKLFAVHRVINNQAIKKGNYIGVTWHRGKHRVQLQQKGGPHFYEGSFDNELVAAITYDREAIRINRHIESINFPKEAYLRTNEIARGM